MDSSAPSPPPRAVFFDVGDTLLDTSAMLDEAILERKGLLRFFGTVVASTAVGRAKPDPRIFEYALHEIGAQAAEAWHVGDDPDADAIGAAQAGLQALLLDPHDLYRALEAYGIARAPTLTRAVDRILGVKA